MRPMLVPAALAAFGLAVTAAILASTNGNAVPPTGTQALTAREQTFDQMLAAGAQGVYAEDQAAGATEAVVGFAVLSRPGFVAVLADDAGMPGRAIGSAALPAGGGQHVAVPLGEPLAAGAVYYAMLYADDGDGAFDPARDRQATDGEGNVAVMSFVARDGAVPEDGPVEP